MDCSTIIVSYNTFELTREAVHTALRAASGLEHEVIVVDNDSPDESADRLREVFPVSTYPNVHIIANQENAGFSKANNQGAALAQGDVLFFLNPDTIVRNDAVRQLVTFLRARPDIGAAGPRVFNPDGSDQASTLPFQTAGWLLHHYLPIGDLLRGADQRTDTIPLDSQPVDIVVGCALALRRDAFDKVRGWDESYFMYAEETELCWSLQETGYTNYFLREAEIVHYGGASSRDRYAEQQLMACQSAARFLRRHNSRWLVGLNRVAGFLGFAARAVAFEALARLRPEQAEEYRPRREAASKLWRWFLTDYS